MGLDVLLKGHTDSPDEVRDAFRSTGYSSSDLLLRHVGAILGVRHAGVSAVFAELAGIAYGAPRAKALAHGADIAVRTLYRAVTEAGLAPVAVMIRVIRAANAFDLIRFRGFTLERAAHALGYSSPRQLSGHLRGITGRSASSTKSVPRSRFLEAALDVLIRRETNRSSNGG